MNANDATVKDSASGLAPKADYRRWVVECMCAHGDPWTQMAGKFTRKEAMRRMEDWAHVEAYCCQASIEALERKQETCTVPGCVSGSCSECWEWNLQTWTCDVRCRVRNLVTGDLILYEGVGYCVSCAQKLRRGAA